jgi:hypothetical protein
MEKSLVVAVRAVETWKFGASPVSSVAFNEENWSKACDSVL